jgi:hypothetical protein
MEGLATASSVRPSVRVLGIIVLVSILGGCGIGSVGIVSAADEDSESAVTVQPTKLDVLTPAGAVSGEVALPVGIQVDVRRSARVERLEYSLRGADGPFHPATPLAGYPNEIVAGQRITGSELASRGEEPLNFVWNASRDLAERQDSVLDSIAFPITAAAVIRIVLRDETTGSDITSTTKEFVLDERLVDTVAGGGVGDGRNPGAVSLLAPAGIASDARGRLILCDTGNHRLRRVDFDPDGAPRQVQTIVGNGFRGIETGLRPARATGASFPNSAAVDAVGGVFFSEVESSKTLS